MIFTRCNRQDIRIDKKAAPQAAFSCQICDLWVQRFVQYADVFVDSPL